MKPVATAVLCWSLRLPLAAVRGGLRQTPKGGNPDAAPSDASKGYVSIWCCWPLLSISILRGFACSATGMRSVSTPTS